MPNIVRRIVCRGSGSDLFMLTIGNLLRTLITLGIYEPWGRSRVRSYLWSSVEFAGERLAYHGTGWELFVGRIKGTLAIWAIMLVAVGVSIGVTVASGASQESPIAPVVIWAVLIPCFYMLFAIAIVGARRYRMSRTSWRGIRFSFRGSWRECLGIMVRRALVPFTLGLAYPFVYIQAARFTVSNTYFGNRAFEFDGQGRDLFGAWLKAMLLIPLTLGLYWFWFMAERDRYVWSHSRFGAAQFRCTATGGEIFGLWLGNLALIVLTLGIAMPYVTVRRLAFLTDHLMVVGAVEVDAIVQDAQQASAAGEGVAAALEIDSDLGIAI